MSQIINTNVAALNSQVKLNKSQMSQHTAMQRLSSGLRINSAMDDAAGMSIAERMTSQIRGLDQATRNANDGISIAQVAEGGLTSINSILQQMRELAVQSANDSNSTTDRQSLQASVQALYDEINRISATTDFNGTKLFSGGAANITRNIQVGSNANQTIGFTVGQTDTTTLQLNSSIASGQTFGQRVLSTITTSGDMTLNGISVGSAAAGTTTTANIAAMESAINNASATSGVSADAFNKLTGSATTLDTTHVAQGLVITIANANGTSGTQVTIDTAFTLSDLAANINRQVGGVNASIGNNNNLILTNDTGGTIQISGTTNNTGLTVGNYNGYLGLKSSTGTDITVGALSTTSSAADMRRIQTYGFTAATGTGTVLGDGIMTTAAAQATLLNAQSNLDTLAGIYNVSQNATDIVKINGVTVGASFSGSAADKATAINAISAQTNVTATAQTKVFVGINAAKLGATTANIAINGTYVTMAATDISVQDLVREINSQGVAGVQASADAVSGMLVLTSSAGLDIAIGDESTGGLTGGGLVLTVKDGSALATGAAGSQTIVAGGWVAIRGKITLTSTDGGAVRIQGDGTATGGTGLGKFGLAATNGDDVVIGGGLNVSTAASANAAITAIDNAINLVNTKVAALGSVQNRFTSVISNLQTTSVNMQASRSRIQDADFASESANLSRSQILQQAGMAMLAQANQTSQGVLALLR